jgi:regulator of sigma E protease
MLSALAVVFGLGVIVFFHEAGHFLVAKLVGLDAPRFSIGFPPHLLKKKIGKTEYCIGAVPLGGYVKVNLGTFGDPVTDVSWFKRALVAVSGPVANLVLTALILILVFGVVGWEESVFPTVVGNEDNPLGLAVGDTVLAVNGKSVGDYLRLLEALGPVSEGTLTVGTPGGRIEVPFVLSPMDIPFEPLVPAVIDEAMVGMPAYEAGIRPGDRIVAIGGSPVRIWDDFQRLVLLSRGPVAVVFSRNGDLDTALVTPQEYDGRILMGVTVSLPAERHLLPPGRAVVEGLKSAVRGAADVFTTLLRMFSRPRELIESSGGPVYVAETLTQQARTGLTSYLWTIASISLAIMIFNLLPIPVLDGGQVLMLLIEGIRGKPLSRRGTQIMQQAGVALILTIFVLIMFKDITRVITRVR